MSRGKHTHTHTHTHTQHETHKNKHKKQDKHIKKNDNTPDPWEDRALYSKNCKTILIVGDQETQKTFKDVSFYNDPKPILGGFGWLSKLIQTRTSLCVRNRNKTRNEQQKRHRNRNEMGNRNVLNWS